MNFLRWAFLMICFFAVSSSVAFLHADVSVFNVSSSAFGNGEKIPVDYTCKGENRSPELSWTAMENAKSYALICVDLDAGKGVFTHWTIYNIPPKVHLLPQGVAKVGRMEGGILQGTNSFKKVGYDGPCPPPGPEHRYVFTLYALDRMLDVVPGAGIDELKKALEGHIVAEASLTGIFSSEQAGHWSEPEPTGH